MSHHFDIKAGQIWLVKNSEKVGRCKALVLRTETIGTDDIVHIALIDEQGEAVVEHMPFSRNAFCQSVSELHGISRSTYSFEAGYDYWRAEYGQGCAGIFGVEIAECAVLPL